MVFYGFDFVDVTIIDIWQKAGEQKLFPFGFGKLKFVGETGTDFEMNIPTWHTPMIIAWMWKNVEKRYIQCDKGLDRRYMWGYNRLQVMLINVKRWVRDTRDNEYFETHYRKENHEENHIPKC